MNNADWHASVESRLAEQSAKRKELWDTIRRHEHDCAQRHEIIVYRLTKLETRQDLLYRVLLAGFAVVVSLEISRFFT